MLKYFNDLKKNDVLISNEKKINNVLINNYSNIEDWWKKPDRHKVVKTFKNNFCKKGELKNVLQNII